MVLQFASPFVLLALLSLPVLWLVLRATPPAPLRALFPPLALLRDLRDEEETPDSAPLWLRLLRLGIAALIILALSGPTWSPPVKEGARGPLVLVVDNGWSSAPGWTRIKKQALALANTRAQSLALVFTANDNTKPAPVRFTSRAKARQRLNNQSLTPWAPNRDVALKRLQALSAKGGLAKNAQIIWLSDGLDHGHSAQFMAGLATLGSVQVYMPDPAEAPLMMAPPQTSARGLTLSVYRAKAGAARDVIVQAIDEDGSVMAPALLNFALGETVAQGEIVLPLTLRNRLKMLQTPAAASAGGSWVFDGGWARPLVGLITPGGDVDSQPLLSGFYYLGKALDSHAELVRGELDDILAQNPSAIILTDPALPTAEGLVKLDSFVRAGGLLIRFAGPHLAASADDLVPVKLRAGGRLMGGAFGWETPQELAPFAPQSPFFGLQSRTETAVRRQVLALPDASLNEKVWARLQDGTPLVSSMPRGLGRVVLYHVTASPNWSDLPLSGLFATMLERTLAFAKDDAGAVRDAQSGQWELGQALTAKGRLLAPPGAAPFLPGGSDFQNLQPSAKAPPGLYRNGPFSRAVNIGGAKKALTPLSSPPDGIVFMGTNAVRSLAFKGPLLLVVLFMLGLDVFAALWLAGRLRILRKVLPKRASAAMWLGAALMMAALGVPKSYADAGLDKAIEAAQATRLAYILTGDGRVDEMSRAGLYGLSQTLSKRTTVEPEAPVGVNPASDNLSVFSFIYWPVLKAPNLTPKAVQELDSYLKNGGMLVIDTQDGGLRAKAAGGADPALKEIFSQISVPALRPVDADHVLTRTYYLIHDFPGRYTGGRVWVESDANGSSLDGVSGIIAGSNDWAAAWALDNNDQPIAALSDDIPRQREMARRFGINLVMYALTGNYKADQVHIPALLERLGEK